MKKNILLLSLLCAFFLMAVPNKVKAQNDPFYYESISNPSKTINFLVGVYYTKNEYITRDDGTGYTKMRIAVINKEGADPFTWSDYKIYIMLKNGDLFYNYTTKAEDGELACKWTVQPGQNHIQYVCFDKAFDVNQIDRVWLGMSDNKFFDLVRSDKN
ncbi:MAG TPA: hypothetical protein VFV46_07395 [Lacibacter sp.]|nr:hypothetical protein [Lacibacter sp.]